MKRIGFKKGVNVEGVRPETWAAIGVIASVMDDGWRRLIVTSLTDGVHPAGPLHANGFAVDIRTRGLTPDDIAGLKERLVAKLDPVGFDVVIEADHIHVEFDPKAGEAFFQTGVS